MSSFLWIENINGRIKISERIGDKSLSEHTLSIRQKDYNQMNEFKDFFKPYFSQKIEQQRVVKLYKDKISFLLLYNLLDESKVMSATITNSADKRILQVEFHKTYTSAVVLSEDRTMVNDVRHYIESCIKNGLYT